MYVLKTSVWSVIELWVNHVKMHHSSMFSWNLNIHISCLTNEPRAQGASPFISMGTKIVAFWDNSVGKILHPHCRPEFLVDGWSQSGTWHSLGRNLRIKGETGHHKYPTDTRANEHLLLSAGDKPMPQGSSRIKRSHERLTGQGGLSKVSTMTHGVSPCINSGVKHFSAENTSIVVVCDSFPSMKCRAK